MFFFIWQDNFLTNISEIDDQHRKLVALINNLYAALLKFEDSDQKRAFLIKTCLLYTSPSPRDRQKSRMPSSA